MEKCVERTGVADVPDFDHAEKLVCAQYSERAMDIFRERYCLKGELISEAMWRVALTVGKQDCHKASEYFNMLLLPNKFIPNTPTWTGAGTRLNQLAACFVLPIDDDMESIFNTLRDAALIQRSGGGVGFNFGHLRPANALVKSSGGKSSGPISFLTAYDAVFQTIAQGYALVELNKTKLNKICAVARAGELAWESFQWITLTSCPLSAARNKRAR